jgi:hypothetical protein
MIRTSLLVAAALGAALAVPLTAQHAHGPPPADSARRPGMPGMPGMPERMGMQGSHDAMAFTPAHLLEQRERLALTPAQVARLEALRDAARAIHDPAAATARAHDDSLAVALDAALPDTAVVARHFRAHHEAMGRAHGAMLHAAAQAKALLTEAQRAQAAEHRGQPHGGGPHH